MKDFYVEGYLDNYEGLEINECPYEEGTEGREGWLKGWRAFAGICRQSNSKPVRATTSAPNRR